MRRETANVLLLLLGGALLRISFTGTYTNYVKPSQLPFLIGAGVLMVGLAVVSIVRDLMANRPAETAKVRLSSPGAAAAEAPAEPAHEHEHDPADDDAHHHEHRTHSTWLLLLPVLAIFLIAPPALGADSVDRGNGIRPKSGNFAPLGGTNDAVIPLKVIEFANRAAWDPASVSGRPVRLTGFVVNHDNKVFLVRMAIACCAADAWPTKVEMAGDGLTGLRNDTWIEVVGKLRPNTATEANNYVSTLDITQVRQVPQPGDPYEY